MMNFQVFLGTMTYMDKYTDSMLEKHNFAFHFFSKAKNVAFVFFVF